MRIDCYGDIDDVFVSHEAIVWQQFVAIGYGNKVYFVPLEHCQPATIGLGSYFAHLVPLTELLLVASGKRLFCIAPHGHLNGSTPPLAIDGVVIDKIDRQVIYGRGDWDPPGGWRPFQVDLSSGRLLSPP